MKRYITAGVLSVSAFLFAGCNDWLREDSPMLNKLDDFYTGAEAAMQTVNAAYTPLMWEYNSTYYCEWFIGDIASDDALKGGQNISDMADAYDIDNFKTIDNNGLLLQYYRAQFQGIQRANLAIEQISAMPADKSFDETLKKRLIAEAKYLRAFYYFRLVRIYGGVPRIEKPIYSSKDWVQPRASIDAVFELIVRDLSDAQADLPSKSKYAADDMGRATKGAAQAMLLKAYLYWGNYKDNGSASTSVDCYAQAKLWGDKFMEQQSGEYSLCSDYADNFTLAGENGPESVFEIQYMEDPMSDYGEGNGFSRGTFTTMLIRSRSSESENSGWGFDKPTDNLLSEYEDGDKRKNATIRVPSDNEISNKEEEIYLGCRNLSVKRSLTENGEYVTLAHDARSPINNVVIRLADVYLMYAEVCLKNNDASTAKDYLEKVRSRARAGKDILKEFPDYEIRDYSKGYALVSLNDTPEDLEKAIRHERRVELAMEGHRWFDICRWGIAKEVMDAYKAAETSQARSHMSEFVKGKHEWFPIPHDEALLSSLEQNPEY